MTKKFNGIGGVFGVVASFTLVGAAACGSGFSSDCMASHTCVEAGGEPSAEGGAGATEGVGAKSGAGEPGAAGTDASGRGGSNAVGGADETGETGGAGGVADTGCHAAADCSNGDPADGEEICDPSGACLAGNPPPTVISVAPEDGAVAVEPDGNVVIKFNEPLDPKTVTKTTIEILDGDTPVPGDPAYANNQVTFTPTAPLALLGDYTVKVTTDVTDADGAHLLNAFSSKFSTRDGAWHTAINAVSDPAFVLSSTLPISGSGQVLLAWAGGAGGDGFCPTIARWFLRGAAGTPADPKSFSGGMGTADCDRVSAAANDVGIGAVTWNLPDVGAATGNYVQQFRDGQWQATDAVVSPNPPSYRPRLAVSPTGVVTLFAEETFSNIPVAWRTNAAGAWLAQADPISTLGATSPVTAAFDSKGNGLAVWSAYDQNASSYSIEASSYTTSSGKWAPGVQLPGSTQNAAQGAPAVAFASNGDALVLWVNGSVLTASRVSKGVWSDPEKVSGALNVNDLVLPPGLAFDGQGFVAAWTAKAAKQYTYTARYDLKTGWSASEQRQSTAADGTSIVAMPRLASSGRGDAMLVWAMGTAPNFTLKYQRYAAGAWSTIQALPGGSVTNADFGVQDFTPLSANSSGLAAIAWANRNSPTTTTTIRLASFY